MQSFQQYFDEKHTSKQLLRDCSAKMLTKAMELKGDIDQGSMARLRKDAKDAQTHSLKAVQMLSNALAPVVNIDSFLPRSGLPANDDIGSLTKKPVLIACADEERKQSLVYPISPYV